MHILDGAPNRIDRYKEVATRYKEGAMVQLALLTPQERVFIYYFMRASLPGSRILTDQLHRNGLTILDIFETLILNKNSDLSALKNSLDIALFFEQVIIFLAYLWTNHGQYFAREHANEKRTPARLGLELLTEKNMCAVFEALDLPIYAKKLRALSKSLFDETDEPTCTVSGSIEESGVNFYSHDFTQKDFDALDPFAQTKLNAYFYVSNSNGKRTPHIDSYRIGGKYGEELSVAHYWLNKAFTHAKNFPAQFDRYFCAGLEALLDFLISGNEADFQQHSKQWLASSSRLDYTFGFIETYQDPKSYRGSFEAEVTIKTIDIKKLNALLPAFEQKLPFPTEFMRTPLADGSLPTPNASINLQLFGSGEFGPLNLVAAYCLPNYSEIRAEYGSKQIIYQAEKSLESLVDPALARKLKHSSSYAQWLEKHDPDNQLFSDLWTIHVILHETLGHGSGKLAEHTFNDKELRTVASKTYGINETIQVTSENLPELLLGYEQTLEELRAEIIALYTSIVHVEELCAGGFLGNWLEKIGKNNLIDALIIEMAATGLRRLTLQPIDAKIITGDHARANYTIMNYLLDGGGIAIKEETIHIHDSLHTVLDIEVCNQAQAISDITTLMVTVQKIKSTGDGCAARNLINTYGIPVRNQKHIKIMHENRATLQGDVKAVAALYPIIEPVFDAQGNISDALARWPKDLIDQQLYYRTIRMEKQ